MENLKKRYPLNDIMLIYYGGSNAYGTEINKSDADVVAVIKNQHGLDSFFENKKDYIIIGYDDFLKAQNLSDDVNDQLVLFADSILACSDSKNIIYLAAEFKATLDEVLNKKWNDWIPKWLIRIIPILKLYTGINQNIKKQYHIYRLRAMLDRYDQTGSFSLALAEPYKSKMVEFKKHYKALENKDSELKDLISYFYQYAERKH